MYAGNSPVNLRDPSGLCPDCVFEGGTLAGITGYGIATDWGPLLRQLQTMLRDVGGGSGSTGGFAGGAGSIGPAPAPARHSFMVEHQACFAAALDATIATATDISFLVGAGEIAAGAKVGSKLVSVGEEFLVERLFRPRTFTSAGIATASGRLSTTVLWGQFIGGVEGKGYSFGSFLKGIIPGINAGLQIANAVHTCRGETW